MKQILVSGSTAYDTLLHFDGSFVEQTDAWLNMSVMSSSYDKNAWGTGANIVYNLSLLWENPILLSSVWYDHEFEDVISSKANLKYLHKDRITHTANSVIVSDNLDNRMTFFHPWAMIKGGESKVSYVEEEIAIAIVSANDVGAMLEHARELKKQNIEIFIDPIIESLDKVIVTYGAEWSHLFTDGEMYNFPAIAVEDFDDTTWAWDAYRAGLLKALIDWHGWKIWCQLGTILASYCILAPWSQHHHFSLWNVMEDLKSHYWVEIDLYERRKY